MRLLHALGRSLASSAIALVSAGLCAPAEAQPSYRASHNGQISEFATPRREGFDRLIVQLPPLVPIRSSEKAVAVPTSPAAPPTAAAAAAPEGERTAAPARIDAAEAKPAAPPHVAPVLAPAPVEAPLAPTATASAVAAPAAPAAVEPVESRDDPATKEAAAEAPLVAEAHDAPSAATPEAPVADEAKVEAAEPASPAASPPAPAPLQATNPTEEQESDGLGWAALVVAMLALVGFMAAKRVKARREPASDAAEPVSRPAPIPPPAAPAPRVSRVAGVLGAARGKLGPMLLALLQKMRKRRGGAKADAGGEPQAVSDWARIGATLRARAHSPVDPVSAPSAAGVTSSDMTDAPASRADARRWEQDREEGVELFEPGSVGARSLVMSARRKLQAAGER
jgi:hypothetical protein